jgi:hypothetical protein
MNEPLAHIEEKLVAPWGKTRAQPGVLTSTSGVRLAKSMTLSVVAGSLNNKSNSHATPLS